MKNSSFPPSLPPSLPPSPQTLLQMVERMECQIQEKREAIRSLQTQMCDSATAAEEAERSLRESWEKMVEGGREGGKDGGKA